MPAVKRPFKDRMFLLTVRTRLTARLVRDHGYTRADARELAQSVNDDLIESAAKTVSADGEPPEVGAGGILAFLLEFLQSPLFEQLLALLLGLFAEPATGTAQTHTVTE